MHTVCAPHARTSYLCAAYAGHPRVPILLRIPLCMCMLPPRSWSSSAVQARSTSACTLSAQLSLAQPSPPAQAARFAPVCGKPARAQHCHPAHARCGRKGAHTCAGASSGHVRPCEAMCRAIPFTHTPCGTHCACSGPRGAFPVTTHTHSRARPRPCAHAPAGAPVQRSRKIGPCRRGAAGGAGGAAPSGTPGGAHGALRLCTRLSVWKCACVCECVCVCERECAHGCARACVHKCVNVGSVPLRVGGGRYCVDMCRKCPCSSCFEGGV